MNIKETAILFILLLALCLTFQSSAFASNPTHIDRGPGDVYITAGHDTIIQLCLWKINCCGDDWPLEGSIEIFSYSDDGTWTRNLGLKQMSYLGDAAFKVGSDFVPGHVYNLTFIYSGDEGAGYDPCENYVNLHVNYPTSMNVTNIKSGYYENVYLSAKLKNDYTNEPLPNRNVTFTVYRTIVGSVGKKIYVGSAMTDSNGIAVLPYRVPVEDGCKVVASYNGENLISSCSGSGDIAVSHDGAKNTRMNVQRITGYRGDATNLTSQLTYSNGNPICNKSITFRINNTVVGSAITDSNGTATLAYNITQTNGTYNLDACFYGDGTHDNCVGSEIISVDIKETMLTVNSITSNGGETDLTAKLTDSHGTPLVNKNVTFKINHRSVGTAITDKSGIATLPYNVLQIRTKYIIEAEFSGDSVYGSSVGNSFLSVTPNTILKVDNVTANYGNQSVLTAKLCYSNVTNLANKNITFKINNEIVGSAITNSQGVAVLPYKITQTKGNYTIQADFAGDEVYESSTGTATLTINTLATTLKLNNITTNKGKTTQPTAQLNDQNGNPVINQTITFKINNTVIGTAKTNSNGTAVLPYKITQNKGNYIIQAEFAGDEVYEPSTGTAALTINTVATTIKLNKITTNKGKTVQLKAQLLDKNGNPIKNEKITFKIKNTVIGTVTTNSKGIAVINYLVKLSKGNYKIIAQFAGDDLYSKIQGTAFLSVK